MAESIHWLIYIGSFQPPNDCAANLFGSMAANAFQASLLTGLRQHGLQECQAITLYPVATFPRGDMVYHRGRKARFGAGIEITLVPFINMPLLKPLSQAFSVLVQLLHLCSRVGRPDAILLYNDIVRCALPSLLVGCLWSVPVICVAADVHPLEPRPWRVLLQMRPMPLLTRLRACLLRCFDGVVVLSGWVAADFCIERPTLHMEGGIVATDFSSFSCPGNYAKVVMYSGNLNDLSGARLLLDAFALVQRSDCQLWFTGRGPLGDAIQHAAATDTRIRFYGLVDRVRYLELMRQATVLVNPRLSSYLENRYNFPSKLLEYLASGRPVITTATADVAEEYGDKVLLLRDETPDALAWLIEDVCSRDPAELDAIGARAREYVLKHKTWEVQTRRVCEFLCQVVADHRFRWGQMRL